MVSIVAALEGNLTGCIYSHTDGADDPDYDRLAPVLRPKVGRLLNDKMPTGVTVVPSMNHGGPYPATGYPGFAAVGIPASMLRFGALYSYDNIRPHRLPIELRDQNSNGTLWRLVDGTWTQADLEKAFQLGSISSKRARSAGPVDRALFWLSDSYETGANRVVDSV